MRFEKFENCLLLSGVLLMPMLILAAVVEYLFF